MKKMVKRSLFWVIVIGMSFSLGVNYYLQLKMSQRDMVSDSYALFSQINIILSDNKIETENVIDVFEEQCLIKTKAAAYIMQHRPEIRNNLNELKKIADLLQIDELHIFNTDGTIISGTEPKYYGYNFSSGEQMKYFTPLLTDKSLALIQPITPNTAEGKLMQYAAAWQEDGKAIIQIGMEPKRVLEVTEKNDISYIFSLFTEDAGTALYAIDPETKVILGCTNENLVGLTIDEIGLDENKMKTDHDGFHSSINGRENYCVFQNIKESDYIIGRTTSINVLYKNINENTAFLALYLIGISLVMVYGISKYLDSNIISGINHVNSKLQNITNGNLEEKIDVDNTPEFTELSGYINRMVESLLATTDIMSTVLDAADIPIGVYEYGLGMDRVRTTNKVSELLDLSENETEDLTSNYKAFEQKLDEIKKNEIDKENSIYQLSDRFIKLGSIVKENVVFGFVIDVTKDIKEKKKIEQERDEDQLTGLFSRRAFYHKIEQLFGDTEKIKNAAMIMIDMDNLKKINDCYGHRVGDFYLQSMADIIRTCTAPLQISSHLSGDEFAIFIYGCETKDELMKYIQEIDAKQTGYQVVYHERIDIIVEFSMGTAFYLEDGDTREKLLKCADNRMYENKKKKKEQNN